MNLPAFQCATAAHPHPPTGPGPPGSDQGDGDGFAVYRAITRPGSLFLPGIRRAHVIRGLRDGADLWLEGRNRLRSCHLHIADARRRFRCPTGAVSPTERALFPWPQALASSLGAEIARWFENTQRLAGRLAETVNRQEQLEALVAALEQDNEQLRRELDELRTERASVAEILRALADDLHPT